MANITGSPTAKPTNIVLSREGQKLTVTWKATDSNATSESNVRRVTNGYWDINTYRKDNGHHMKLLTGTFKGIGGSFTITIPDGCGVIKEGYIGFANTILPKTGAWIPTFTINAPSAPSLAAISYDSETGQSTYKLTGVKAELTKPRKGYHIDVYREGVVNGAKIAKTRIKNVNCLGWDTNEDDLTYTITYTEPTGIVKETDYIKYTINAYAKGIWGNSKTVSKSFCVAYPAKPTIKGFTKTSSGGTVSVASNRSDTRPTETLQMQINYASSKSAIDDTAWSSVGSEFQTTVNWQTPSFGITTEEIQNKAGQHVFLRCKATGREKTVYSDVYMVDDKYFYWSERNDQDEDIKVIQIVKAEPGEDSESIKVSIGYATNSKYDACLLSYSKDKDAWMSTKQPETFEMTGDYYKDSTKPAPSSHANHLSIKIAELDADTTYYMRARLYSTSDETKHTLWSQKKQCNTSQEEITGLVLSVPDIVATNKECSFSWEFPEGLRQVSWTLFDADKKTSIEHGTGVFTLTTHKFTSSGTKHIYVQSVFDDGRSMNSDTMTVPVVDAPKLTLTTAPTDPLTTLPQNFKVTADNASADIQVKVTSEGIVCTKPDGAVSQYMGDVVFSQQDIGAVDCTITDGTKLWQDGTYKIEAVATANGVKSDVLTSQFTINYSATVENPASEDVIITASDMGRTIQVNNLAEGLTWDLYRATKDMRNVLISSGNASGDAVEDKYAPYSSNGKCEYIVLVKNAQGQYSFNSYEYKFFHKTLRFDWSDKSVELPYNIEISDETDKQFEQQIYLDGTQRGAWGASVIRSSSLSTDTVYIKDEEVQKKIRELARYQGAVFVRTPLGQAYTANVEVKDINKTYDKKAMAVSFDCTEIDLTSDFMAEQPITPEPEPEPSTTNYIWGGENYEAPVLDPTADTIQYLCDLSSEFTDLVKTGSTNLNKLKLSFTWDGMGGGESFIVCFGKSPFTCEEAMVAGRFFPLSKILTDSDTETHTSSFVASGDLVAMMEAHGYENIFEDGQKGEEFALSITATTAELLPAITLYNLKLEVVDA